MPSFAQFRRDLTYLAPSLVFASITFTTLTSGLVAGFTLLLVGIGVPLLALVLEFAKGLAALERRRIYAVRGQELPPTFYQQPDPTDTGFRRVRVTLADPQRWRDLAFGVLAMPVTVVTWSIAICWVLTAVAGTLYPLYGWALPHRSDTMTLAELIGWHGYAGTVVVNTVIGVVALLTCTRVVRILTALHVGLARTLLTNEKAALLELAAGLAKSRSAAVHAETRTLRRIERDIHDGPQQRLVRLTMDLEAVRRRLDDDPAAAQRLVEEAITQSHEALSELRALSRGIAPPILLDRGLEAALAAAVARCPVATGLECELSAGRLGEAVETAAYFVVSEALTNVAKHSGANSCAVRVTLTGATLWLQVIDDGRGGAHLGAGHGLAGLADRLIGVDGRLDVHSPAGGPTVLTAEIPVASP